MFNIIIQTATKSLVAFEKWDFPDQVIKNEIWRSYIQKFISLTLYILLQYDGLYEISFIDYLLGTSFASRVSSSSCKYDKVGVALANLAITEIFVLFVAQTGKAFFNIIWKGMIKGQPWRPPRTSVLSDMSIWMFYNKAIHWLTIMPIPYYVVVIPFVDYIGFQLTYVILKHFYVKPTSSAQDISTFLMILMNGTQFYCMVIQSLWFIDKKDHNCGPIPNGMSGWDPIERHIEEESHFVVKRIYSIVILFPFLWLVVSYLTTLGYLKGNQAQILQNYEQDKKDENM